MTKTNIFIKPIEYYQRQLNPIQQYIDQTSFYVSKMTGKPLEACKEDIRNKFNSKQIPGIRNPVVRFFERLENDDRVVSEIPLTRYISEVVKNKEILVPTFTSYCNPEEKKSLISPFIDYNVSERDKLKKEAFRAKMAGDKNAYAAADNGQNNKKIFNNAMSGSFATKGSALHNPTSHSSLTSTIRSVSSVSNASNERVIGGNRYYHNYYIVLNNLISITSSLNKEKFRHMCDSYKLIYPTVQDVMDCIEYSTRFYWKNNERMDNLRTFVEKLDDIERAAFVYIGDLYHIRKHNPDVIRNFLDKISSRVTDRKVDNPAEVLKSITTEQLILVKHIFYDKVKGLDNSFEKYDPELLNSMAATWLQIDETLNEYAEFIDNIFLTGNLPPSTATIPNMIRRVVVLSDTDSTMFSVDEWVKWRFGEVVINEKSIALATAIMYIATQAMQHLLMIFSANMGVERHKLGYLQMKPEYTFPVFVQGSISKHYFTCITVREGNVYNAPEMEIKGVHLKSSNLPNTLVKQARNMMEGVVGKVMRNEKISLTELLTELYDTESTIMRKLKEGDVSFYRSTTVKDAEAYSRNKLESPYINHMFWEEILEPKYGNVAPPPYRVIQLPLAISNKTDMVNWINNIEDKELAQRLANWCAKYNKQTVRSISLPLDYVASSGMPKEIEMVIDYNKTILRLTNVFRLILEAVGFYCKKDMLLHEMYDKEFK